MRLLEGERRESKQSEEEAGTWGTLINPRIVFAENRGQEVLHWAQNLGR